MLDALVQFCSNALVFAQIADQIGLNLVSPLVLRDNLNAYVESFLITQESK